MGLQLLLYLWLRNLSYPDITLLPLLAEVLGVTTGELLNGEKNSNVDTETTVDNALNYAEKTVNKKIAECKMKLQ